MDLRKLKTLIDLVSESGISELEVNEGEDRVRIVNSGSAAPAGQIVHANPAPAPAAQAALLWRLHQLLPQFLKRLLLNLALLLVPQW